MILIKLLSRISFINLVNKNKIAKHLFKVKIK